ncbi:hypothetical protein GCM10027294_23420 [Marinactinospora endophytica]
MVVAFVAVGLTGPSASRTAAGTDGWNAADQGNESLAVVETAEMPPRAGPGRRAPRRGDQPRGVPRCEQAPIGMGSLFRHNIRLAGGPAPVRAHIDGLSPDILDGAIEPGRILDATTDLSGVPAGYRDMDEHRGPKVPP